MPLSKTAKIIIWSVSGLVVIVGGYFGFKYFTKPKDTTTTDNGNGTTTDNGNGTTTDNGNGTTINNGDSTTNDSETETITTLLPHSKKLAVRLVTAKANISRINPVRIRRYPSDIGEIALNIASNNIVVGYTWKEDYEKANKIIRGGIRGTGNFVQLLSGRSGGSGITPYIERYVKVTDVKAISESMI